MDINLKFQNICKIYKHKCINLHNALLPHSRGVGVKSFLFNKRFKNWSYYT